MPGANYMGGKRNAARARIKDAEGKAQRSHFGKKRFEVLRTGLSKGGVARDVQREPPEITLAHARRRRGQDGLKDEREWERNSGLRSPSTRPVSLLRSPPVNTTSGRSKILSVLDADDPAMQRAQVQEILQTPDLLGLSKSKEQMSIHKAAKSESRTPREPSRRQKSPSHRHVSLKSPTLEGSPSSTTGLGHFQRTPSSRSTSQGPAILSSPGQSSRLSSRGAESVFVPMFLDSSPPTYADSGYAEFWSDPYRECEAARVPFYAQPANADQRHLPASSMSGKAASPSISILSRSSSPGSLGQFARSSYAPSHGSFQPPANPSHLELSSPLVEAQFVSDIVSPRSTQQISEPLQLSNKSGFSWSELASLGVLGSPDIPQASFSQSPQDLSGLSEAEEGVHHVECPLDARYMPSQGSVASSELGPVDNASEDIAWLATEEDTVQWDCVCLEEVLGGLPEDADPWNALSKLLGLPSSPVNPSGATEDTLAMLDTFDRRGVGYTAPGNLPCSTSIPTYQELTEKDSRPPNRDGLVSPTGVPLDRGDCEPCTGHQAREMEAEFVKSPITETVPPHGSFLPPRCSRNSRNPCRQSLVISMADRPGTTTMANQTVGNGEGSASEVIDVGNAESLYVTLHSERNKELGLVDGPSLFDDDDFFCCEE